jgi:hypothetical protein
MGTDEGGGGGDGATLRNTANGFAKQLGMGAGQHTLYDIAQVARHELGLRKDLSTRLAIELAIKELAPPPYQKKRGAGEMADVASAYDGGESVFPSLYFHPLPPSAASQPQLRRGGGKPLAIPRNQEPLPICGYGPLPDHSTCVDAAFSALKEAELARLELAEVERAQRVQRATSMAEAASNA